MVGYENPNCVYFARSFHAIFWASGLSELPWVMLKTRFQRARSAKRGGRNMKRRLCIGSVFLTLIVGLGIGLIVLEKRAAVEAATVQAPMFEVDPLWPKPLPNHWIIGQTIGV